MTITKSKLCGIWARVIRQCAGNIMDVDLRIEFMKQNFLEKARITKIKTRENFLCDSVFNGYCENCKNIKYNFIDMLKQITNEDIKKKIIFEFVKGKEKDE